MKDMKIKRTACAGEKKKGRQRLLENGRVIEERWKCGEILSKRER